MAIREILTNVDLGGNQIQNALLHPLSSAPSPAYEGQVYYNTSDDAIYMYDGSSWIRIVDTTYNATTDRKGIVERATDAEVSAGTDTERYITPKQLSDSISSAIAGGMHFKGTAAGNTTEGVISNTPYNPATKAVGDEYKVIAGTGDNVELTVQTGSGTKENAKIGDTIICTDATNNYWVIIPSGDEPGGTVTSIIAGDCLTGGTITTSGTIAHADIETTTAVSTAAVVKITTDGFGHIKTTASVSGSDIASIIGAQSVHTVYAGPSSGSSATPTFRTLVADDLPNTYGDSKNPYGSKTANYVLAAPNGSNGTPSFRALVSADIPALGNIQNTGALQTTADVTIANGDKLVITDASDSNKVARASLTFDGSTTDQFLAKSGAWVTLTKATVAPGAISSTAGSVGSSTKYALEDHTHKLESSVVRAILGDDSEVVPAPANPIAIARKQVWKNPASTAGTLVSGEYTWTITHGLDSDDISCTVKDSDGSEVFCKIIYSTDDSHTVTIKMNFPTTVTSISANEYTAVLIG